MYKKIMLSAVTCFSVVSALSVSVFAADGLDVNSVLSESFTSISGDLMSTIGTVLPIALGILGATIAITFGIKWFKRLTGGKGA